MVWLREDKRPGKVARSAGLMPCHRLEFSIIDDLNIAQAIDDHAANAEVMRKQHNVMKLSVQGRLHQDLLGLR
jgi:hypothetical protein